VLNKAVFLLYRFFFQETMKLAISGWRGMTSKEHVLVFQQAMEDVLVTHCVIPTLVITGGARGADALGEGVGERPQDTVAGSQTGLRSVWKASATVEKYRHCE
jgi:hypothetical protein